MPKDDTDSSSESDSDSDSDSEQSNNQTKIALGVGVGVAVLIGAEELIDHIEGPDAGGNHPPGGAGGNQPPGGAGGNHHPGGDGGNRHSGGEVGASPTSDAVFDDTTLPDEFDEGQNHLIAFGSIQSWRSRDFIAMLDNGGSAAVSDVIPSSNIYRVYQPTGRGGDEVTALSLLRERMGGYDSDYGRAMYGDNGATSTEHSRLPWVVGCFKGNWEPYLWQQYSPGDQDNFTEWVWQCQSNSNSL